MATAAVVSKDTNLKIKIGASFTKIVELKDFSGLFAGAPAILDATHLESAAKEKLLGIKDEGSLKFTFNFVPADAGQAALFTARDAGTSADFQLTLAKAAKMYAFSGFVMTAEPTGGVDKIMELGVTVEITGAVVTTAVV
jgi:hypothetical protein